MDIIFFVKKDKSSQHQVLSSARIEDTIPGKHSLERLSDRIRIDKLKLSVSLSALLPKSAFIAKASHNSLAMNKFQSGDFSLERIPSA